jgi:hypothetical protein
METSGYLNASATLPPGKEPPVPFGQEARWPQYGVLPHLVMLVSSFPLFSCLSVWSWHQTDACTLVICRPMPDIDSLMQEWPTDVEQQLQETGLPLADLDCDLPQYVDIVCSKY